MLIAFVLFLLILIYGLVEYRCHINNVKSVPTRILVNGTRGKTSVSRLVAASLSESGLSVMCRTTGSSAEMIWPDGRVEKIVRKRGARILEMVSFFKEARKANVDCVVIECMALQEENQRVMANTLVKPGIVAITNTYIDHIPEMGKTHEETAYVLSQSVPKGAKVYVTDDYYNSLDADVHKVDVKSSTTVEGSITIHAESWALAKAILNDLGVSEDTMLRAKDRIAGDIGLIKQIEGKNGSVLIPTFSVNDKECMEKTIRENIERYKDKKIYLIFNSREDREHRIVIFKDVLLNIDNPSLKVFIVGDWRKKIVRYLSMFKIESISTDEDTLSKMIDDEKDGVFIGLGNIKGSGEKLIGLLRGDV